MSDRQGGGVIAVGALISTLGALWSWQTFQDRALMMVVTLAGFFVVFAGIYGARNDRTHYGAGEQLLALVILAGLLYVLFRWGI